MAARQIKVVCPDLKDQCRAGLPPRDRVPTWIDRVAKVPSTNSAFYAAAVTQVFGALTNTASDPSLSPRSGQGDDQAVTSGRSSSTTGSGRGGAGSGAAGAAAGAGSGAGAGAGAGADAVAGSGSGSGGGRSNAAAAGRGGVTVHRVPGFSGNTERCEEWLVSRLGQGPRHQGLRRVLCVFAQMHSVQFCPGAPTAAALALATGASEAQAYGFLLYLYKRDDGVSMPRHPFTLKALSAVILQVLAVRHPKTHAMLLAAGAGPAAAEGVQAWLSVFFLGYLPDEDVLRAMDGALNEGPKVFVRVAVALLKRLKPQLAKCTSADQVRGALSQASTVKLGGDGLFAAAYKLARVSRTAIEDGMRAEYLRLKASGEPRPSLPPPWYHVKLRKPSTIATPEAVAWLVSNLFEDTASRDWKLMYSTDVHGWGLIRLYGQCGAATPCVFLVEATPVAAEEASTGAAPHPVQFGVYIQGKAVERARMSDVGAAALFVLAPGPRACFKYTRSAAVEGGTDSQSGAPLVALFTADYAAFGGNADSASVAVRLDATLTKVTCGPSTVFGNPGFPAQPEGGAQAAPTKPVQLTVSCVEVFTLVGDGDLLVDVGL